MKLHLPSGLRAALFACFAAFAGIGTTLSTATIAGGVFAVTLAGSVAHAAEPLADSSEALTIDAAKDYTLSGNVSWTGTVIGTGTPAVAVTGSAETPYTWTLSGEVTGLGALTVTDATVKLQDAANSSGFSSFSLGSSGKLELVVADGATYTNPSNNTFVSGSVGSELILRGTGTFNDTFVDKTFNVNDNAYGGTIVIGSGTTLASTARNDKLGQARTSFRFEDATSTWFVDGASNNVTLNGNVEAVNGFTKSGAGKLTITGTGGTRDFGAIKVQQGGLYLTTANAANNEISIAEAVLSGGASLYVHNLRSSAGNVTTNSIDKLTVLGNDAVLATVHFGSNWEVGSLVGDNVTLKLRDEHSSTGNASLYLFKGGEENAFSGKLSVHGANNGSSRNMVVAVESADMFANAIIDLHEQQSTSGFLALTIGVDNATILGLDGANANNNTFLASYAVSAAESLGFSDKAALIAGDGTTRALSLTGDGTYSFLGMVGDNLTINKTGSGEQTLGTLGSNVTVNVSGGTLKLNPGSAAGEGSKIYVLDGGTVEVAAWTVSAPVDNVSTATFTLPSYVVEQGGTVNTLNVIAATGDTTTGTGTEYTVLEAENYTGEEVTIERGYVAVVTGGVQNPQLCDLGTIKTITLDGAGLVTAGSSYSDATYTVSQNLVIGENGGYIRVHGDYESSKSVTEYVGSISGSGTLTKQDGGIVRFSGDMSGFTGLLTLKGGTIDVAASSGLNAARIFIQGGGTLSGTIGVDDAIRHKTSGTLKVSGQGTVVTTSRYVGSDGSGQSTTLEVTDGARLVITGSVTAGNPDTAALVLSHWSSRGTLNIENATVDVLQAGVSCVDGPGYLNIKNGGVLNIKGLTFEKRYHDSLLVHLQEGGTLNIGADGIGNFCADTYSEGDAPEMTKGFNITGGTIGILSTTSEWSTERALTVSGDLNINTELYDATKQDYTGAGGTINLNGALTLNEGASLTKLGVGQLNIGSATTSISSLTINGGTVSMAGGTIGTLTTAGGSLQVYATTDAPSLTASAVAGGSLSLLAGGITEAGTYKLLAVGEGLSAEALDVIATLGRDLTLQSTAIKDGVVIITVAASGISADPQNITWGASSDGTWINSSVENWTNGADAARYADGDTVTFNDSSIHGEVNIVGAVAPAAVVVDSDTTNYVFAGGSLSGAAALTKSGSSTLTMEQDGSAYTGNIALNEGTLAFAAGSLGSGNITVANGTTLKWLSSNNDGIFDRVTLQDAIKADGGRVTLDVSEGSSVVVNGALDVQAGTVVKLGDGTLTLNSGTNALFGSGEGDSYPGALQIGTDTLSGGTVVVDLKCDNGDAALRGKVTVKNGTLLLAKADATSWSDDAAKRLNTIIVEENGELRTQGSNQTMYDMSLILKGGLVTGTTLDAFGGGWSLTTLASDKQAQVDNEIRLRQNDETVITVADGAPEIDLLMTGSISTGNGSGNNTSLTKAGDGTLQLSGSYNFAKPVKVAAGGLIVDGCTLSSTLTVDAGNLTVQGGGTVSRINAFNADSNLSVTGTGSSACLHLHNDNAATETSYSSYNPDPEKANEIVGNAMVLATSKVLVDDGATLDISGEYKHNLVLDSEASLSGSGNVNFYAPDADSQTDGYRNLILEANTSSFTGTLTLHAGASDTSDKRTRLYLNSEDGVFGGIIRTMGQPNGSGHAADASITPSAAQVRLFKSMSVGGFEGTGGSILNSTADSSAISLTVGRDAEETLEFGGSLGANINLVKKGSNSQSLTGSLVNFNGSIEVAEGALGLGAVSTATTVTMSGVNTTLTADSLSIGANQSLVIGAAGVTVDSALTLAGGSLTLSQAAYSDAAGALSLGGNALTLSGSNTLTLQGASGEVQPGTEYILMRDVASVTTGDAGHDFAAGVALNTLFSGLDGKLGLGMLVLDGTTLKVSYGDAVGSWEWNSSGSGTWAPDSNDGWDDPEGTSPNNESLVFGDAGIENAGTENAGTTTITISGDVAPGSVTVNAESGTYEFTGSSITTGTIEKSGDSTLTLANTNTSMEDMTINEGTVQLGKDTNTAGSWAGDIDVNGTSTLDVVNVGNGTTGAITAGAEATVQIAGGNTLASVSGGKLETSGDVTISSTSDSFTSVKNDTGTLTFGSNASTSGLDNKGTILMQKEDGTKAALTINGGTDAGGNIVADKIDVSGNSTFGSVTVDNGLLANGNDVTLGEDSSIKGTLGDVKNLTTNGTTTLVSDNMYLTGNLSGTGGVDVQAGQLTLTAGTANIDGTAKASSNVNLNGVGASHHFGGDLKSTSGSVTAVGAVDVDGALTAGASVSVGGAATVTGSLTATNQGVSIGDAATVGVFNTDGTVQTTSDLSANWGVSVAGTTKVTGNLTATRAVVDIDGDLTVGGNVSAGTAVVIDGAATIKGSLTSGNNGDAPASDSKDVTIGGTVDITGSVTAGGSVTLAKGGTVTGGIQADSMDVDGSINVGSDSVIGNVKITNGIDIADAATVKGNVESTTGYVTIGGTADIVGSLSAAEDIIIRGDDNEITAHVSSTNGSISFGGATEVKGNVAVGTSGLLTLDGTLTVTTAGTTVSGVSQINIGAAALTPLTAGSTLVLDATELSVGGAEGVLTLAFSGLDSVLELGLTTGNSYTLVQVDTLTGLNGLKLATEHEAGIVPLAGDTTDMDSFIHEAVRYQLVQEIDSTTNKTIIKMVATYVGCDWESSDGKWDNTNDWAGGGAAIESTDVVFNGKGSSTVTLESSQEVRSLLVDSANGTVKDYTFTSENGSKLIAGTELIVKSGSMTISGTTDADTPTLTVGSPTVNVQAAGKLTVESGAQLLADTMTVAVPATSTDAIFSNKNITTVGGALTATGTISNTGTLSFGAGSSIGTISGAGKVVATGSGNIVSLSGATSFETQASMGGTAVSIDSVTNNVAMTIGADTSVTIGAAAAAVSDLTLASLSNAGSFTASMSNIKLGTQTAALGSFKANSLELTGAAANTAVSLGAGSEITTFLKGAGAVTATGNTTIGSVEGATSLTAQGDGTVFNVGSLENDMELSTTTATSSIVIGAGAADVSNLTIKRLDNAGSIVAAKSNITLTEKVTNGGALTANGLNIGKTAAGSTFTTVSTGALTLDLQAFAAQMRAVVPGELLTADLDLSGTLTLNLLSYEEVATALTATKSGKVDDTTGLAYTDYVLVNDGTMQKDDLLNITFADSAKLQQAFALADTYARLDVVDGNLVLRVTEDDPRFWGGGDNFTEEDNKWAGNPSNNPSDPNDTDAPGHVLDLSLLDSYTALDTVDVVKLDNKNAVIDLTNVAPDADGLVIRNLCGTGNVTITGNGKDADNVTFLSTAVKPATEVADSELTGNVTLNSVAATVETAGKKLTVSSVSLNDAALTVTAGSSLDAGTKLTAENAGTVTVAGTLEADAATVDGSTLTVEATGALTSTGTTTLKNSATGTVSGDMDTVGLVVDASTLTVTGDTATLDATGTTELKAGGSLSVEAGADATLGTTTVTSSTLAATGTGSSLTAGDVTLSGDTAKLSSANNATVTVASINGSSGTIEGTIKVTGNTGSYSGKYGADTKVVLDGSAAKAKQDFTIGGDRGSANLSIEAKQGTTETTLTYTGAANLGALNADGATITLNNDGKGTLSSTGTVANSTVNVKADAQTVANGTAVALTSGITMTNTEVNVDGGKIPANVTFNVTQGTEDWSLFSFDGSGVTDVNLEGEFFARYFRDVKVENGVVKADLITDHYTSLLGETENGTEGIQMLDMAALQVNPQAGDLANLIKSLDDHAGTPGGSAAADRLGAAVAGSGIASLGMALSSDLERQLKAIRNRTTTMGVDPSVVNEDMPYFNAWINAEGDHRSLKEDSTMAGYTLTSWGGTVGFDVDVNPSFTCGLALTAMYADFASESADVVDGDVHTYYISTFARAMAGAWTHTFVATVGKSWTDVNRTVRHNYGNYVTNGDADGVSFGLMYEVARTYALNEDATACWQPVFNVAYRHTEIGGYTETGSDAGLRVGDQSLDTVTFGLGGRLQAVVGENLYNRTSVFEGRALVKFDAGDREGEVETQLLGASAAQGTVKSAEMDAFGFELGAGLTIPMGMDGGSVFVDGSVEFRGSYTSANATLGYRFNF